LRITPQIQEKKKKKKEKEGEGEGDASHGKCLRDVSVSLFQTNKQGIYMKRKITKESSNHTVRTTTTVVAALYTSLPPSPNYYYYFSSLSPFLIFFPIIFLSY